MALLKIFGIVALWNANLLASIFTNIANADKTVRMPWMFVLGLVQILVYFVVFSFFIKKFNYHTPGREGNPLPAGEAVKTAMPEAPEVAEAPKETAPAGEGALEGGGTAMDIIEGLGGKDNINTVENCITRLRVNLKDPALIQDALINRTNHKGIIKKGSDVQIIYGLQVADIRRTVEEYLNK